MAGPREQSADTSLDDILSSIRKIVSDDLNGADALRDKLSAAQAAGASVTAVPQATSSNLDVAPVSSPMQVDGPAVDAVQNDTLSGSVAGEDTAALIAAARLAAGTPAREFVTAEARPSQGDSNKPRETLAPFDRGVAVVEPVAAIDRSSELGAPIVLPTEQPQSAAIQAAAAANGSVQTMNGNGHHSPHVNGVSHGAATEQQPMPEMAPQHAVHVEAGDEEPFDLEGAIGELNGAVQPNDMATTDHATSVNGAAQTSVDAFVAEAVHVNGVAVAGEQCDSGQPCMNGAQVSVVDGLNSVQPTEAPLPQSDVVAEPETIVSTSQDAAPEVTSGAPVAGLSSGLLEQTVTRLLRPMLKEWLDENMPRLIEEALRQDAGPSNDV